jgi:hypothetical protein
MVMEEKMDIIGHPSARRVLMPNGWLYATPGNQALAVQCACFMEASLPELDDFIERLEADGAPLGMKLRNVRERALDACTKGDQDSLWIYIQLIAVIPRWQKREENLLPLARKTIASNLRQSVRAQGPRGKIIVDDGVTSISKIISELALSKEYEDETAKELWLRFIGDLDALHLNPKEDDDETYIEYDFNGGRKQITFKHFATEVSAFRTGKKSV